MKSAIIRTLGAVLLITLSTLAIGQPGSKPMVEIAATFKGHTEPVYAVALTPDGRHLATGSFDHSVKLWDLATGAEVKAYQGKDGHTKIVLDVAINPEGTMLASVGGDNSLKIWDVPVNAPIATFPRPDAPRRVAMAPDGTKLAIADSTGKIVIVNPKDFKEQAKFESTPSNSLSWNAGGTLLASAGADGTVSFLNVAKNETTVVGGHRGGVNSILATTPNNVLYSVGQDGQLRVWSPPTPSKSIAGPAPVTVSALAADGQTLVLAGADKSIRLASLTTIKEIRALTAAPADVASVAINASNTLVAAGRNDGQWTLWNAADGKIAGSQFAHAGKVSSLAFHPQLPVLASGGADGAITLWSLPPVPSRSAAHSSDVVASVPTIDGKKLITAAGDRMVRVFESTKMTLEKQFPQQPTPITALATTGVLHFTGGDDGIIRSWNPATGKAGDSLGGHASAVTSLNIDAGGTLLVSSSDDRTVKAWRLPLPAPKIVPHPDAITSLSLYSDGQRAVTGGADRIVRVVKFDDGSKPKEYAGATVAITSVAASPGGQFLAATSADKTAYLWNTADNRLLMKWPLPTTAGAIAFHPDNSLLAVGLSDGVIKVFKTADLKETKEASSLAINKGAIASLAYHPKGDQLVVGCADKVVQIVSASDGAVKGSLAHVGPVTQATLSRDGARIAAVAGKSVKIWSFDGKETGTIVTPADGKGIGFSPDASRIAVACVDRFVRLYDIDGNLLESFAHDGPALGAVMPDNGKVISIGGDKSVRQFSSALRWRGIHAGPVRQVVTTPKGDKVFSAGDDKTIKIWNGADGKEIASLPSPAAIRSLSVSPDALRLASLNADKSITIRDLSAKPEVAAKTLTFADQPTALALNPAGPVTPAGQTSPMLAIAQGKDVAILDAVTGGELQRFKDHTASVVGLAFLADQKTLATASKDQSAKFLTVTAIGQAPPHAGGVTSLRFVGGQLVSSGADKIIRFWDVAKKAETKTFGPLPATAIDIDVTKDGQSLAAAAGKQAIVWNVADGKTIATIEHPANVRSVSLKNDKTRLVTSADDQQARLWDLPGGTELQWLPFATPLQNAYLDGATGANIVSITAATVVVSPIPIVRVFRTDAGPTHRVVLAPSGQLLTAGADKKVKTFDASTGKEVASEFPTTGGMLRSIAIAKSGLILAAGGDDKIVHAYTLAGAKEIATAPAEGVIQNLQFTPNGQTLVVQTDGKKVLALDATFVAGQNPADAILKPLQIFTLAVPLQDVAMNNDNVSFYAVAGKDVQFWRIASPTPVRVFAHPGVVNRVVFHPKTPGLVATASQDGKVRLYDIAKNALVKEISAHAEKDKTNPIYSLSFSADGARILTSSYDHSAKLLDAASGNVIREFKAHHEKDFPKGHMDEIYAAALSPDGKLVATGSGGLERVIKIWNASDGSFVRDLIDPARSNASHPGWIQHVRFLNGGRLLSVGDAPKNQGHFAIWNVADGKLLASETTSFGAVFGFDLSADEKTLAVGAGYRGRTVEDLNNAHLLRMTGINR